MSGHFWDEWCTFFYTFGRNWSSNYILGKKYTYTISVIRCRKSEKSITYYISTFTWLMRLGANDRSQNGVRTYSLRFDSMLLEIFQITGI